MQKYGISVIESLKRTVIVKAESLEAAIQKVEEAIENEEIILDADDYDSREIESSGYWKGGKIPEGENVSYYQQLG